MNNFLLSYVVFQPFDLYSREIIFQLLQVEKLPLSPFVTKRCETVISEAGLLWKIE